MIELAEKGDFKLIEDDDDWKLVYKDNGKVYKSFAKKEYPKYPLALVLKWGYKPLDVTRLNEIAAENKVEDTKRVAAKPPSWQSIKAQSENKKYAGQFKNTADGMPVYRSKAGRLYRIPEWETYEDALAVLEDCDLRGEDIFETRYRGFEWEPEEGVLY